MSEKVAKFRPKRARKVIRDNGADTEFELNFSLESYNAKCVCIQHSLSATRVR